MDFFSVKENVGYRNPIYGKGIIYQDKVYYAYSQFAREIVEKGSGEIIGNESIRINHFEPSHLRFNESCRNILLMFAGGFGDAVTLGTLLPDVANKYDITFDICSDRVKWDTIFKPMGMTGKFVTFPPDLQALSYYDAVLTDITKFYPGNDGLRISPVIQLCRGFKINPEDLRPVYNIPEDIEKKWMLPFTNTIRVAVNFDSNGHVKSYPEELIYELLKGLYQIGFEVYILGIKKKDTKKYPFKGIYDLRSHTTIPEAATILSQMDVVLGVDSLMIHLSNLLEKPSIVLLSTTPSSAFEWHRNISCLSSKIKCSPCFEVFDHCPIGYEQCRAFYHKSINEEVIIKEIIRKVYTSFSKKCRKNEIPVNNM